MSTIRVWRRAADRVDVLDIEEYLRGVLHSEMP
jgi:peptidoglycan hydrolase-like amidase